MVVVVVGGGLVRSSISMLCMCIIHHICLYHLICSFDT